MSEEDYFDRNEFISYFRDECDELLGAMESDLLRLEALPAEQRNDPELINALFRALHTIKGSSGMLDMHAVAELAHRLESVCDLLRKERLALSDSIVNLLLEGQGVLSDTVRDALQGHDDPVTAAGFLARLETGIAASTGRLDGIEDETAPARVSEPEGAPSVRESAGEGAAGGTIRVDVEKLDVLLDLVGELVINRTRIVALSAQLNRRMLPPEAAPLVKELVDSAALLSRTTAEMQESVMRVRMVPIGGVFERFPRVVRDLARTRGKEIALVVQGADTNLDRAIVGRIGEPLMHLVRNCVDHGIELPQKRRERGKLEGGTIWLRASHAGNQIVIEVADDGNGIDFAAVRKRGIEHGLLDPSAHPSAEDLHELLFEPGLSTAEAVSDISGRGVGMDVVRSSVSRLGGTIEIESVPQTGTRITLKLPLTLAIAQALLVRVLGELYAIPIDAVVESHRVEPTEIFMRQGFETIELHDRAAPLIRLGEAFGFCGPALRPDGETMVVIAQVGGRLYALGVDEFLGDREIVIKPLSEALGPIPGISGATILGDGTIALILDVSSLVHTSAAAHLPPLGSAV